MDNPIAVIALLAVGLAIFFAIQARASKKRVSAEDKVMKGYFLLGLSGLMAKIAMADGRVTPDEASLANKLFVRMALTDAERAMCVGNFVTARRDGLTARDHAKRFQAYANGAACEFLYDLLWRISRADGTVDLKEEQLLADIATYFGIGTSIFENFKAGKTARHDKRALWDAGVPPSLLALVP